MTLTEQIKDYAQQLGFELVGITPAKKTQAIKPYKQWLDNGYAGEMNYLKEHLPLKGDARSLLPEAKSLISLGINYHTIDPPKELGRDPSRGQISRYAWGEDYHIIVRSKLRKLVESIESAAKKKLKHKICVDTAPIIERDFAESSGIGWVGKNTNLINWESGSWYFLAEILINVELDYNWLPSRGSCGTCTRCIEACPTDAILEPNVLDSRLCISYLTIELKDSIPKELRPKLGNLIFGCDICQEVCPWNSKAISTGESAFYPREENLNPTLLSLINMTQQEFSKRFKNSTIKRTKRRGFLRNIAVALGNWGGQGAIPALKKACRDPEPLVRGHAAWALGKIGGHAAKKELLAQLHKETDRTVVDEIEEAIRMIDVTT